MNLALAELMLVLAQAPGWPQGQASGTPARLWLFIGFTLALVLAGAVYLVHDARRSRARRRADLEAFLLHAGAAQAAARAALNGSTHEDAEELRHEADRLAAELEHATRALAAEPANLTRRDTYLRLQALEGESRLLADAAAALARRG